jgi:hypothetical protein
MVVIYRIETYTNETHTLTAMVAVDDGLVLYKAVGQMQVNTPRGPQMVQFPFEIPGATLEEAFANLPAALAAGQKATEAEIRKQQLVVPTSNGHIPPNLRLA